MNDHEYDALDTILGIMMVVIVVMVCAFVLGLVWQLSAPLLADVLTTVWGWVK